MNVFLLVGVGSILLVALLSRTMALSSRRALNPDSFPSSCSLKEEEAEGASSWRVDTLRHCLERHLEVSECYTLFNEERKRKGTKVCKENHFSMNEIEDDEDSSSDSRGGIKKTIEEESRLSIAIIGANGYIGSSLLESLSHVHNVTGYDKMKVLDTDWQQFDVVIHVAGVDPKCSQNMSAVELFEEVVMNPSIMASRMNPSQVLLLTSSSALSHKENDLELENEAPDYLYNEQDACLTFLRHRENIMKVISAQEFIPSILMLRLGEVVGVSRSQRVDVPFIKELRNAYILGYIRVNKPDQRIEILAMDDLSKAISSILKMKWKIARPFQIYDLYSFSCSMASIANEISAAVGVSSIYDVAASHHTVENFTVPVRIYDDFNFVSEVTRQGLVDALIAQFPRSVMSNGVHSSSDKPDVSVSCQVCGTKPMGHVLDLHLQPLANSFKSSINQSMEVEKFPLRLVRCPKCGHVQLTHVVDRSKLFESYLYQSNTTMTIHKYFDWFAEKVVTESNAAASNGTVIEIACNDGSQLDYFQRRGWRTIGVDPAKNLIAYARRKGHEVHEGFWGAGFDTSQLPPPEEVDAIVAQNVFAHVDSPVEFLKVCAKAMSSNTKLYVQTSQCEMIAEGQFDTAYHEHISFFSGHSFFEAAKLSGLHMAGFEETPVHGVSCLVTFELPSASRPIDQPGRSVVKRLNEETQRGENSAIFYHRFEARAVQSKEWMQSRLRQFHDKGYPIGGYGAAAKGIVLLHYLNEAKLFQFVVDDAPLKQSLYCPGTGIPIWNTSMLLHWAESRREETLVLVIFAWNFWSEIANKLRVTLERSSLRRIYCLVPFPTPTVLKLDARQPLQAVLASLPKNTFSLAAGARPKLVIFAHFCNAEDSLREWVRLHAALCHEAVLLDRCSSEGSVRLLEEIAPARWRVVSAKSGPDGSSLSALQVLDGYKEGYADAWTITMGVHEHLMVKDIPSLLRSFSDVRRVEFPRVFAMPSESCGATLASHSTVGLLRDEEFSSVASNGCFEQGHLDILRSAARSAYIHGPSSRDGGMGVSDEVSHEAFVVDFSLRELPMTDCARDSFHQIDLNDPLAFGPNDSQDTSLVTNIRKVYHDVLYPFK